VFKKGYHNAFHPETVHNQHSKRADNIFLILNLILYFMDRQENYTHYYDQLREIYKEKYPHNPDGVLTHHLTHRKLPIKTSILLLASENGIHIPEIQQRLVEGATLEDACTELAQRVEFNEDVISRYEEPRRESKAYVRTSIDQITVSAQATKVALYGRVVALYVGKRVEAKTTGKAMQFTLSDGSGMILVEASDSLDQTLMRGTIVKVNGETRTQEGYVYVSSSSILRLQTVEDGYQSYVEVPLEAVDELPQTQGGRLVKSAAAETAESVTVERKYKSDYIFYGIVLCISFIIPVLGFFTCIAGAILLCIGLTTKELEVTSWEKIKSVARLIIEHHPPWLRDRCLHLRVLGADIYPCARCTGTVLGLTLTLLLAPRWNNLMIPWLLALPAFLDWGTQKLGLRESNNKLRLVSGFILGAASALVQPMNVISKVSVLTSYAAMSAFILNSSRLSSSTRIDGKTYTVALEKP
jgi:uncharacterized membrane protein